LAIGYSQVRLTALSQGISRGDPCLPEEGPQTLAVKTWGLEALPARGRQPGLEPKTMVEVVGYEWDSTLYFRIVDSAPIVDLCVYA
jgi:hypothetical protein